MRRWPRIGASCFFLVLGVGTAALWVRSYYFRDGVSGWDHNSRGVDAASCEGELSFVVTSVIFAEPPRREWHWRATPISRWREGVRKIERTFSTRRPQTFFGFSARRFSKLGWRVTAPHWFFVLTAGALAVALKPRPRRRFSLGEALMLVTAAAALMGGSGGAGAFFGLGRRLAEGSLVLGRQTR